MVPVPPERAVSAWVRSRGARVREEARKARHALDPSGALEHAANALRAATPDLPEFNDHSDGDDEVVDQALLYFLGECVRRAQLTVADDERRVELKRIARLGAILRERGCL